MGELSKGNYVEAIFLALAKAFHCVDHTILCSKLEAQGIKGTELSWFTSHLEKRKQGMVVNGCMSDVVEEKPFGVQQGSEL
eukprot:gene8332-9229_t